MYYILPSDVSVHTRLVEMFRELDVYAVFHYILLHSAPANPCFGRAEGTLNITEELSDRLLWLPMWIVLEEHQEIVINTVTDALR